MRPHWISNITLISVFIFCYLVIYCKAIALGYRVSDLEKKYQQLKNWNSYYRSQILKELSLDKVKQRAGKLNLSLEIPDDWRIIDLVDSETQEKSGDKKAYAGEKK